MKPARLAALAMTVALLLPLVPSRAHAAQGVALAWNHCFGDARATQNAVFACDTNAGSHILTGSFRLNAAYEHVNSQEIVLDLKTDSATLPAWWTYYQSGTCRQGSMSANRAIDPTESACQDWASVPGGGGLATYCTATGTCFDHPSALNAARIKLVFAVAPQDAMDLLANQDYFTFNLVINHAKTVGTGSCAGCTVPVCIVLNSINVVAGAFDNRFLSNPSAPGSNYATWQGGGGVACPAATPTRRSTWGAVKTLYR